MTIPAQVLKDNRSWSWCMREVGEWHLSVMESGSTRLTRTMGRRHRPSSSGNQTKLGKVHRRLFAEESAYMTTPFMPYRLGREEYLLSLPRKEWLQCSNLSVRCRLRKK